MKTTIEFTKTEKEYIEKYGKDMCISAYKMHMKGNGGNTVGEEFLHGIVSTSQFTRSGDVLINAGRKLTEE